MILTAIVVATELTLGMVYAVGRLTWVVTSNAIGFVRGTWWRGVSDDD